MRVVAPTGGFSLSGTPGEALWDADANAAFLDELGRALAPDVAFETVDADVNATAFADLVAERARELFPRAASVATA